MQHCSVLFRWVAFFFSAIHHSTWANFAVQHLKGLQFKSYRQKISLLVLQSLLLSTHYCMCWLSNSSLYSPPVLWQCQHQPPSFFLRAGLLHTSPSSPCQLEGMPHQCAPRSGASWRWTRLKWAVARLQLRAPPSLQRDLAVLHLAGSLVARDLNRMHWTVFMFCSIVTIIVWRL